MADEVYIKLGAHVVDRVQALMPSFGESDVASLLSSALGLLEGVKDYVEGGVLTVIDPAAPADDPDDGRVEFIFKNVRSAASSASADQPHVLAKQ